MHKRLLIADLFCGAGGTTTGAARAVEDLGREAIFVAVNHWPTAIATHSTNHPHVRHYCMDLDSAKPNELVPEGYLDLLLASPECRYHSLAQGARPLDEQNRASAWHVLRWAERLYVKRIVVENVANFLNWGPCDRRGRPVQSQKGELFLAWVGALRSLGYKVEWKILNAADYGTASTRKRLFVQARRDGKKIVWPQATHGGRGKPWRGAREIIDWSLKGTLLSERSKPLSKNTLARIEEGARRYWGEWAEPFIVVLRRHADAQSVADPLPTLTSAGTHIALASPELTLLAPVLIGQHGGSIARHIASPLSTITTDGAIAIAQPVITAFYGAKDGRVRAPKLIDEPLDTIPTENRFALVEPLVMANRMNNMPRSVTEPTACATTAGGGGLGLIEPYLIEVNHQGERNARALDEPLPTVTCKRNFAIVDGDILQDEQGNTYRLDIRFRMLEPHELAAAMDFPKDYRFAGTKTDATRQIGNAVPVRLADALTRAALHDIDILTTTQAIA